VPLLIVVKGTPHSSVQQLELTSFRGLFPACVGQRQLMFELPGHTEAELRKR
jgi:hypothetical protein